MELQGEDPNVAFAILSEVSRNHSLVEASTQELDAYIVRYMAANAQIDEYGSIFGDPI